MRLKYSIVSFHILIVIIRLVNLFIPQTWSRASLWMIYVCGRWLFDCVIIKIWFRSTWSISRVGKLVSFSLLELSKTGLTYPLRFLIIFHCCLFWRAVWAKYLTTITAMVLSICDGKGYSTKNIISRHISLYNNQLNSWNEFWILRTRLTGNTIGSFRIICPLSTWLFYKINLKRVNKKWN